MLDNLEKDVECFATDVERVDFAVADIINWQKNDFYDNYSYLKPDCEKNGWERFCDGCKKVGEWCKEHWKLIITVVIVVVAVVLICTGVGGILGATALGALLGTAIGGTVGGVMSVISGGSFFEGFENGAFSGAISGIISGGMGFAISVGGAVALTLGQTLAIGGVSGMGSSFISDLGDKFIKGENISWENIVINALLTGTVSAVFAGTGYGISKGISSLLKNSSWLSNGRELFRFGKTLKTSYGKVTSYTTSNPKGISLNFANNSGKSLFRIEFDISRYLHYHLPLSFGTKAHVPLSPVFDTTIGSLIGKYLNSEKRE